MDEKRQRARANVGREGAGFVGGTGRYRQLMEHVWTTGRDGAVNNDISTGRDATIERK